MSEVATLVKFDTQKLQEELARVGKLNIDNMAFGAVELDARATILRYNKAEGDITGRNPAAVIGKNFFSDVAPCTRHPDFHGRFQDLVAGKIGSAKFDFTFDYQMKPTRVSVIMNKSVVKNDKGEHTYWVFVKRL